MAIAGHVSPKMLAHYSHVRMEAKRRALDSLASKPAKDVSSGDEERGYGTKDVTNPSSEPEVDSLWHKRRHKPVL
jgi:hypothetical protein